MPSIPISFPSSNPARRRARGQQCCQVLRRRLFQSGYKLNSEADARRCVFSGLRFPLETGIVWRFNMSRGAGNRHCDVANGTVTVTRDCGTSGAMNGSAGPAAATDPDSARAQLAAALSRVSDGDRAALQLVYRDTSAKLFGVCLRILQNRGDAEDVLQDVYMTVWLAHAHHAAEPPRRAGASHALGPAPR